MGNAFWLFFALPQWYFSAALNPLSEGVLTAVPAVGSLCLAIGVIWAAVNRQMLTLIFLISPAASQLFVAAAGFLRGEVHGSTTGAALIVFLILQLVLISYLVYRLHGARFAASAFAVFCMSYALAAAFVASMAFNDSWLQSSKSRNRARKGGAESAAAAAELRRRA
jgi:hypothetical protein